MIDELVGESRDGAGASDNDATYYWGNPRANLNTRSIAKLLIMRGYVMDTRAGALGGAADGDIVVDKESIIDSKVIVT